MWIATKVIGGRDLADLAGVPDNLIPGWLEGAPVATSEELSTRWYSESQAAAVLGVGKAFLSQLVVAGDLAPDRVGGGERWYTGTTLLAYLTRRG